jgi:hypothetical protein
MKKRSLWVGGLTVAIAAAAIVVAMTGFGGKFRAADELQIKNPPPGGGCTCPANWAPVVCQHAGGPHEGFSNGCAAGCFGYTADECHRIQVQQP